MSSILQSKFRPPAVPLITHDPYFSIWSFGDKLTDDWTKHWTGKNQAMVGMIRVDGKCYRWMSRGLEDVPPVDDMQVSINALSTYISFRAGGATFWVQFSSDSDIKNVDALTRPVTVIQFAANSGGKPRTIEWYFDISAEAVVDTPNQSVGWSRLRTDGLEALSMGSSDPMPLAKRGDDLRIDWGRAYLVPLSTGSTYIGGSDSSRRIFRDKGVLPESDDLRQPRPVNDDWPVMATSFKQSLSGAVRDGAVATALVAYDDSPSIEYFGRPLLPVWASEGGSFADVLGYFRKEHSRISNTAVANNMLQPSVGHLGPEFEDLATLSYRQCLAAHKIVKDIDGTLLMFSKENFSNGCIGTVDVMYPACPIFLAYNPELLKANMEPIMQYASMPRWKWKFAPHDLGTYPKANGQVYGGGEKTEENQMPVEESGNMLIMAAAYLEKSGDKAWITKYWSKFTEWAEYLKQYGVDPGNQLCTDDFAGHLAHNANLSVKAIVAMACYGKMCGILGNEKDKSYWSDMSYRFARDWMKMADDGDHYRLAFDKPGSWSQKYNLVWDKVLKLNLFPQEVYDKEIAYYLKKINSYGLPLDNRADYTKLDWTVWTACLTSNKKDFETIMAPVYKWMNETPDRIPLTDWYDTKSARCIGFRARSVVGGVFMPLLMPK